MTKLVACHESSAHKAGSGRPSLSTQNCAITSVASPQDLQSRYPVVASFEMPEHIYSLSSSADDPGAQHSSAIFQLAIYLYTPTRCLCPLYLFDSFSHYNRSVNMGQSLIVTNKYDFNEVILIQCSCSSVQRVMDSHKDNGATVSLHS